MGNTIEREFAGKKRASVWTYILLGVVLLVGAIVANLVIKDPEAAKKGISHFLGLPTWALATIALVVGAAIYWMGLKIETDWPEFVGAFIIAGAIIAFELMFGWKRLEFGLIVVPYVIPLFVFLVLIMFAIKRSA
jgi:hypothetical protein